VTDYYVPGREFEARQYSLPSTTPEAWEHVARGVEAEHRTISWLQVPGLVMPRDLFAEDGCVWVIEGAPQGERLDVRILQRGVDLEEAARWMSEACGLVSALHTALTRPFILARLSDACFHVTAEGRLQLAGFQLDHEFRLRFRVPPRADSWQSPERFPETTSDIWCLGNLLDRLLAEADETLGRSPAQGHLSVLPRRVRQGRESLEAIARRALAEAPAERYASAAAMKRDVERALRHLPGRTRRLWRGEDAKPLRSWRERYPLVAGVASYAIAILLLATLSAGVAQIQATVKSVGAGLRSTPLSVVESLPAGTEVWTEGLAEPHPEEDPIVSPLADAPCLAYGTELVREVRREVWDGEEKAYRMASYRQVLLQRGSSVPFDLVQDGARVEVDAGAPEILGPVLEIDRVPQALGGVRVPLLKPGEKVQGIHGREARMAAQERVYVRARVEQENGHVVLKAPADTQVIIYKGAWSGYAVHAAMALLPGVSMSLGALVALGIAGARLRRSVRLQQPWRRRAVA